MGSILWYYGRLERIAEALTRDLCTLFGTVIVQEDWRQANGVSLFKNTNGDKSGN